MLHPAVKLKKSLIQGSGLIAVKKIPKGTILWRLGNSDRIYSPQEYKKFSKKYRKLLDKYSYIDDFDRFVYCTDNAKYWNHSCNPNSSSLQAVDMEIAIKDIQPREEITFDYALVMGDDETMRCCCGAKNCRKVIKKIDEDSMLCKRLRKQVVNVVKYLGKVEQPLLTAEDICPCGSGKKYKKCHGK
ncbi:MAG: SET domain-containing protein-lysine N-methyltransferase [Patescibacteria group bacterium]|mgnify:FL=1